MQTYTKATTAAQNTINSMTNWFAQLPGRIWNWLVNAYTRVTTWGSNTYNAATSAASRTISSIGNWFSQLPGRIWNYLVSAASRVYNWGSSLQVLVQVQQAD